jgi:hypothetical protein
MEKASREAFVKIKELGYDVFFYNLCSNWTMLEVMKNLGVSDIYLVEDICFELEAAAALLHEAGIRIRVFPNICQTCVNEDDISSLKTFFIRPEDIKLYAKYVDTFEFFGEKDKINTLYKIYAKKEAWPDDLSILITNFKDEVPNQCLSQLFGERRIKCGKKCFKGKSCRVCDALVDMAKIMKENNLVFTQESIYKEEN